jgi:hypothetical protein
MIGIMIELSSQKPQGDDEEELVKPKAENEMLRQDEKKLNLMCAYTSSPKHSCLDITTSY